MVLFSMCESESLDISAICTNDVINIGSTAIICMLLTAGIIYVLVNHVQRLLNLHYFLLVFIFFFKFLISSNWETNRMI